MRKLPALALVLLACAPSDRGDAPPARDAQPPAIAPGPDPIVLRIPRGGGAATAYVYPRLDSVAWQSAAPVPATGRILGFDSDAGSVAFVSDDGTPGWLDLNLGTVDAERGARVQALESADGYAIFGVDAGGTVVRLTPAGERWTLTPPVPARLVFPQTDGFLLVLADRDDETVVWRLHPPERQLLDTLVLPRTGRAVRTRVGDRVYFAADEQLIGVRSDGLEPVPGFDFDGPVRALATTPSGDRVFVATDSSREVAVVDRYQEDLRDPIELPGPARALRVDPLGRYLLVRPAEGDSVWVVSVSAGRRVGTVATTWRADLPFVAPDGAVALVRGNDVVFVDGQTLDPARTVRGGAADYWYQLRWSGFRPRAEALDTPVEFRRRGPAPASGAAADSGAVRPHDTLAPAPTPADTAAVPRQPPPAPAGFTVSFAALLSEERARELAGEIDVDGRRARVVTGERAGTPVYRVVLGPYPTRAEAERIGRSSRRTHFVFEGNP